MSGFTYFPGAIDSHVNGDPFGFGQVNNRAYTKLTADLTSGATTLAVADNTVFPAKGVVVCGYEAIYFAGKSGTTGLTGLTRGIDGTTAVAHAKGATVGQAPIGANHNDVAAAVVALETGAPVKIGRAVVIGSPVLSVTFSSIPGRFGTLMLTGLVRSSFAASATDIVYARVNGDSSAIYDNQHLFFSGTSVSASEGIANTESLLAYCSSSTTPAEASAAFSMTIPGYASAVLRKSWMSHWRYTAAYASGNVSGGIFNTGWRSTAPITSIELGLVTASNFVVGSELTLYGLP